MRVSRDQASLFGYISPVTGEVSSHPPLCACGTCAGPVERFTSQSDAACRTRLFGDMPESARFEAMVRSICPIGGRSDEYGVRLGNVEFWIDSEGPWAGQLSHSISTSQWDTAKVASDLQTKLIESAWEAK